MHAMSMRVWMCQTLRRGAERLSSLTDARTFLVRSLCAHGDDRLEGSGAVHECNLADVLVDWTHCVACIRCIAMPALYSWTPAR